MAWSCPVNLLQEVGLRTVPTPADGHCLLHAIRRSWEVQVSIPVPSMEMLLADVHREALVNNGRYKDFFCGPFATYKQEMYSFLFHKIFNTTFVDLVPLMICNSLNIGLCIYDENSRGQFDFKNVVPSHGSPPKNIIYVHRKYKHYSALEFVVCRAPAPEQVTKCTTITRKERDGWTEVSSRSRMTQRSHAKAAAIEVQNRFVDLVSEEEFPALPPRKESSTCEKASRITLCEKTIKVVKGKTRSVNQANLVYQVHVILVKRKVS